MGEMTESGLKMEILNFFASDIFTGIMIGFYLTILSPVAANCYKRARETPGSEAWAAGAISVMVGVFWPLFAVLWAIAETVKRIRR